LTITHHELCFGCGLANLFGLQMEVERDGEKSLAGRLFIKQDHQGPPGVTHGGIVATALDEAMALLLHDLEERALTRRLEVDLLAPAPVGAMAYVRAWVEDDDGDRLRVRADLRSDLDGDRLLGKALGTFVRVRA
jgi:acyl-coenzyme A thioesterase PaaI-like protein